MPELRRQTLQPRRALVALCTAAVTAMGGVALAPAGQADPKPTIEEIQSRVDDLYHQAEQASERYNAATDELTDVQRRLERAQASVTKQEARVAEVTASMAGFASASYQTGGMDPTLRTLLADDPTEFLAQASVLDDYASQQSEQLAAAAAERRDLEQVRLSADEEKGRLEAIEANLGTEKETVESLLDEAQTILDGLEEEERQRLEDLRRDREDNSDNEDRNDDDDDPDDDIDPDVPSSEKGGIAVDFAMAQVGEPYVWAAEGPGSWDCSGLTMMAWREAGVSLSRSSGSQINDGTRVSKSQLEPGDLVFYYSPISHVAVYIGGGQIVHATHPGDVVSVDPIDSMPFSGASRPG